MTDDKHFDITQLGWDKFFGKNFAPYKKQHLKPGRVICQHKHFYIVSAESGEFESRIAGKMRHTHKLKSQMPAVGDWVAIKPQKKQGQAIIHHVLKRKSKFSRKVVGANAQEQIISANIDTVFIVIGLDEEFNLRRIERYLTVSAISGVEPIIVLNKTDVCHDLDECIEEVESIAHDTPVIALSAVTGQNIEKIKPYITPGKTIAMLGSSGVGKSTLINAIVGTAIQEVGDVRDSDSKGRHTTTRRELIILPCGGIVIDNPGMRELQIWDENDGQLAGFHDIAEIAEDCKFRDCTHTNEPSCAVLEAIEEGKLKADRLESYTKQRLERETLQAVLEKKRQQPQDRGGLRKSRR